MLSSKHSAQKRLGLAAQRRLAASAGATPRRVRVSGIAAGHDTLRPVRPQKRSAKTATVAGIWIDRRRAVVATISATGDTLTELRSDIEHEPSHADGSRSTASFESQLAKADDRHQRAFTGHLNRFYDRVIATIRGCCPLFICGPGEAKVEFRQRLAGSGGRGRRIDVVPSGALSVRQIMATVRAHFACNGRC